VSKIKQQVFRNLANCILFHVKLSCASTTKTHIAYLTSWYKNI